MISWANLVKKKAKIEPQRRQTRYRWTNTHRSTSRWRRHKSNERGLAKRDAHDWGWEKKCKNPKLQWDQQGKRGATQKAALPDIVKAKRKKGSLLKTHTVTDGDCKKKKTQLRRQGMKKARDWSRNKLDIHNRGWREVIWGDWLMLKGESVGSVRSKFVVVVIVVHHDVDIRYVVV